MRRALLRVALALALWGCGRKHVDAPREASVPAPAATLHWLEEQDAARVPEVFARTPVDRSSGAVGEVRVDGGVLGFRSAGKTLWLTESEHEPPFQEAWNFASTTYADTAKYRFLYVEGERPFVDILDRNGQRAAKYPIDPGLRIDRVVAYGTQAVLGPIAVEVADPVARARLAQNFLCDVRTGCVELAPKAYPIAMHTGRVLFAPAKVFDLPFVYDLKSARRTELARACQLPLGFVPRKDGPHVVCLGEESSMELDEAGAVVSRAAFPVDGSVSQATLVGEYLVYSRRPRGALSNQWCIGGTDGSVAATVVNTSAGAIALFPDNTFESFGDAESLAPRLTCEVEGRLLPLESCQRQRRVTGRLQRLLVSTR